MVPEPQTKVMLIVTLISSTIPQLSQVALLNYDFPFKLEHNNYVIWKAQIFPVIVESNLVGFITCTIQPPPEFITKQSKDIKKVS